MRTSPAGLLAVLLLIPALAACTNQEAPDGAAAELAEALESGTLPAGVVGSDGAADPAEEYAAAVAALLGEEAERQAEVEVTASRTVEDEGDEDTATTTLDWTWEIDGHEWSYSTTAVLERTEDVWRTRWDPALVEPTLRSGEVLTTSAVAPERGRILGAGGTPLVVDRPVVRFGLDKTRVKGRADAVRSARRVAAHLDVTPGPFVRAVRAAGDRAFVEALVLRRSDAGQVAPGFGDIPGAAAVSDEIPLAPTREFAAPLLGRVGEATAEVIEESDGTVRAGDVVGLSGLQARYDDQLRGAPGLRVLARSDDGDPRTLHTSDPVAGEDLRLSLDVDLQTRAERILADVTGPASAIVALRPSTGAVLAAANGPGTDGQNIATYGQYAPGSTFKLVSALALLRSGVTPESQVTCPTEVVVDGKRFTNYDDYPAGQLGRISLRSAVAHSCNTAFISARDRLDDGELAAAAESLGLGVDHDLGFPAYFGQVPPPESETEAAADLIGQGRVLASPMVMAAVVASVQAGRTVVPWLVEEFRPEAEPARPLTGGEARALRGLMRAVVTEGSGSLLADVPGQVGAKTGTAEYGEAGPGGDLPTHAWMVAARGDLAVAVFVETGESGSRTAGPLLEQMLR